MVEGGPPSRRGSEVLDAIWDQVTAKPERSDSASVLFRAKALEQLDVAAEIDNQLPLVSRRSWLLLVGVAVLVVAAVLWATLTPSVSSVSAVGRVVAAPGVLPVAAPRDGILQAGMLDTGTPVRVGEQVATLRAADGSAAVITDAPGTVWQQLAVPGDAVSAGETVVTLLPPDSTSTLLIPFPEHEAAGISVGMGASVVTATPVGGTVTAVGAPVPGREAAARTGLALPADQGYVLVTVTLDGDLTAGAAVTGQVILSEMTVFQRLLGGS